MCKNYLELFISEHIKELVGEPKDFCSASIDNFIVSETILCIIGACNEDIPDVTFACDDNKALHVHK